MRRDLERIDDSDPTRLPVLVTIERHALRMGRGRNVVRSDRVPCSDDVGRAVQTSGLQPADHGPIPGGDESSV